MNIFLIGPSGVGKTSCARHASVVLRAEHIDLDVLCTGRQFDWHFCQQVLDDLESQTYIGGAVGIVDIGAGIQCSPELRQYLVQRQDRVVLIFAPALEVIRRNPCGPDRSPEEYKAIEYESRQDLYSAAVHVVDVLGRSEAAAHQLFIECLTEDLGIQSR